MNVELTARERFEYDKRSLDVGDDFKATDLHARILVTGGRATYKTREQRAQPPPPSTLIESPVANADVSTEPQTEEVRAEDGKRGTRRYRRRDMQADET